MVIQTKYFCIAIYFCWCYFYGTILNNRVHGIGLPLKADYTIEPLYYEVIPGNEETVANFSVWNFKNMKRTLVLNGNYSYTEDMDNTFLRGIDVYYSSKGNNKYEKLPLRLPLVPMCEFYNTSYRKYIEPHFIGKTNFPTLPVEGYDVKAKLSYVIKGNYWVEGVTYNEENLPAHMPRGTYRLEERFYKTKPTQKMVGGINLFARILDGHG